MNSIGCRNIINYQDFHIFSAEQRRCIEKQSNCYGKTYKWTGFIYLFIYFLLDDGIDFSHLGYKHQETSQSVLFFDDKYSF